MPSRGGFEGEAKGGEDKRRVVRERASSSSSGTVAPARARGPIVRVRAP